MSPTLMHENAVNRISRYTNGTTDYELMYERGSNKDMLTEYSDNDLVGQVDDRKCTREWHFT